MAINYSQFPFAPMQKNPMSLLANPAQTAMQQRNSTGLLNLDPMQVQQARMRKGVADAEALNKRQMRGNMFMALGDAFAGRNMNANFLARQQHLQAQKAAEEKRKQGLAMGESAYDYILKTTGNADMAMLAKNNPAIATEVMKNRFAINKSNTSNERFGLYDSKTNKLIGTVAKDDRNKISEYENDPNITVGQLRSPTVTGGQASNERYGVYDKETKQLIGSVLKSDSAKINELENTPGVVVGQLRSPTVTGNKTGSALQVVDKDNIFVRNITMQDFVQNGLKPGEKLTNLPTGNDPADSANTTDFDPVKSKYLATENIILQTSQLAKQFYKNPNSALAVGTTSQFVDSIIQNIDAGSKILSSAKDTKAYKFIQSNNKSIEGNDFGDRIKKASQSSGVAESRIRDLGYLFAAARGQEGKGLSDKDFENALKIVSGGVGAEGRIKVLEDVANRIKGEFERSVEFDLNMSEDENYTNKLNKLKPLPMFVNPIITTSSSSSEVDALVNKYAD